MQRPCKCGRTFLHCKTCGAKSVYAKKMRSMEEGVLVVGCRNCLAETKQTDECKAASRDFKFSSAFNENNLVEGSDEYGAAMLDWVRDIQEKEHISTIKAFIKAKKFGWKPELYPMDEDIKEAFVNAGLLPGTPEQPKKYDRLLEQDKIGETQTADPIALDEIIRRMGSEQKEDK